MKLFYRVKKIQEIRPLSISGGFESYLLDYQTRKGFAPHYLSKFRGSRLHLKHYAAFPEQYQPPYDSTFTHAHLDYSYSCQLRQNAAAAGFGAFLTGASIAPLISIGKTIPELLLFGLVALTHGLDRLFSLPKIKRKAEDYNRALVFATGCLVIGALFLTSPFDPMLWNYGIPPAVIGTMMFVYGLGIFKRGRGFRDGGSREKSPDTDKQL